MSKRKQAVQTVTQKRKQLKELEDMKLIVKDKVDEHKKLTKKRKRLEAERVREISSKKEVGRRWLKFPFLGRRKLKKYADQSYIITMLFPNGTSKTWVIKTKESTFSVKGKEYYLYYEESFFDLSLNQYHLYYHFNYCVPINREIEVKKESGVPEKESENFFAVVPSNLKPLIKMEYVKNLANSKNNKLMTIVIILAVLLFVAVSFIILKSGGA